MNIEQRRTGVSSCPGSSEGRQPRSFKKYVWAQGVCLLQNDDVTLKNKAVTFKGKMTGDGRFKDD